MSSVKLQNAIIAATLGFSAFTIGGAHAAQVNAAASGYALESSANTTGNNFTMLDGTGGFVGGSNNVSMTWDGTVFTSSSDYTGPGGASNMTLSSKDPFFGQTWTAHSIQVFGPGSYTFDPSLGGGAAETGALNLTVAPGQLGAHMLFNWGTTSNIDVAVLWDPNGVFGNNAAQQTLTGTTVWDSVSVDGNGDGIPGISMPAGGPFAGFNANFNLQGITPTAAPPAPVPVPAAVWLLGSGLMGLVGVARRNKTAA